MVKREEFRVDLTAKDDASKTLDNVASKLEGLNSAATVSITAEDEATEVIDEVTENVEGLDGETAEATLEAEDEASEVVDEVTEKVDGLDEETAEATLTADDQASDEVAAASDAVAGFDGESASATIDATDDATEVIDTVTTDLETLDGSTATVTLDAEGDAASESGSVVSNLGELVGPEGLAALSAGGMLAFGQAAGEHALDIAALASATGGSLDQASRLREVWELAGGSKDTLERMIIRTNDKLRESPGLAEQLGVKITGNMTPMALFIAAVGALNDGQLLASTRLAIGMELFGSKGIITLNDLDTRVGDIDEAMAAVSDNEIITQDDIDNAIALNNSMDAVGDAMGALGRQILPVVAAQAQRVADLLDSWAVEKLIGGFEVLGARINLVEAALLGAGAGEVTGGLEDAAEALETLLGISREDIFIDTIDAWKELQADLADNGALDTAQDALTLLADQSGKTEDEVLALAGGLTEEDVAARDAATATQEAADAAADHEAALQDEISALEAQKDALENATEALDEKNDAERRSVDAFYAKEKALDDAVEAEADYEAAAKEGFETDQDREDSINKVRDAYADLAEATVEQARQDATANGTTLSRVDAIDMENRSLLSSAAMLNGPLRAAVLAHVLRINGIPEQRITEILTDADPNDLAQVKRELDEASKTRKAAIVADANDASVAAVQRALDNIAHPRDVYFRAIGPGAVSVGIFGDHLATGTPYSPGGLTWVGEEGPELVDMPMGARVTNAHESAEMMRNGWAGGTTVNNTTINVPAGTTARDVLKSQRRYARTQAA